MVDGESTVGDHEDLWGHRGFEASMLIPSVMFDFLSVARIQKNVCLFVCLLFRLNVPWLSPYGGSTHDIGTGSFAVAAGVLCFMGFLNILKNYKNSV